MTVIQQRRRIFSKLLVAATVASLALGAAAAADLAGTSWILSGPLTVKAKMGSRTAKDRTMVSMALAFDPTGTPQGGTCTFEPQSGLPLSCTWTSASAKRATLIVDSEPFRAALESELEAELGTSVSLSLTTKPVPVVINPKSGRMTLTIAWVGSATSPSFPKPVKLWINAKGSGSKIVLTRGLEATPDSAPGLAARIAEALKQIAP